MKKSTVLWMAIIALGSAMASFTSYKAKFQVKGEGHDKVSEKLFIDDAFFTKYRLDKAPRSSQKIHDWTSMDKTNKYAVVNDIRWEFDKPEQAMDFHKKTLVANSQKGVELHPKLSIPGAEELHIFKEAKSIEDLNKDLGINTMEYGYIFVMGNVVAKVWVKVNGNYSAEESSVFAKEAAKTIQNAQAK